jgi:hypothetical protein
MSLYPEALLDIAPACEQYRRKAIEVDQLQQCLWKGAQTIVAVEEKGLRDFLRRAEGELELLHFTVDHDRIYERALPLVAEIESRVNG